MTGTAGHPRKTGAQRFALHRPHTPTRLWACPRAKHWAYAASSPARTYTAATALLVRCNPPPALSTHTTHPAAMMYSVHRDKDAFARAARADIPRPQAKGKGRAPDGPQPKIITYVFNKDKRVYVAAAPTLDVSSVPRNPLHHNTLTRLLAACHRPRLRSLPGRAGGRPAGAGCADGVRADEGRACAGGAVAYRVGARRGADEAVRGRARHGARQAGTALASHGAEGPRRTPAAPAVFKSPRGGRERTPTSTLARVVA